MKELIEIEKWKYSCDNCKMYIEFVPYQLDCGYGSQFDGDDFHFCSLRCLKEFMERELKEEKGRV